MFQVLCGSAELVDIDEGEGGYSDLDSLGISRGTRRPLFTFADDNGEEDYYDWPNLFEEADEMMLLALFTYTVTDLRSLARRGRVRSRDPERILSLPLAFGTALDMIAENVDLIKQVAGEADHTMKVSAVNSIRKRFYESNANAALSASASGAGVPVQQAGYGWINPYASSSANGVPPPYLVAYGDYDSDRDTVYAVAVEPSRKRVTVAFRGSATPHDLLADFCFGMKRHANPLKHANDAHDQDETVGLHRGFYELLLQRRGEGHINKFEEIMPHVVAIFSDPDVRRDYKLYVTGHSLGGALATLFAFETAAAAAAASSSSSSSTLSDHPIPTPVTCVSVASPRVGDASFQRAFRHLEGRGLLRHLRIANDRDPVTVLPRASSKRMLAMLSPVLCVTLSLQDRFSNEKEMYRHTGMRLKLYHDGPGRYGYELVYSGASRETGGMCNKLVGVTEDGLRVVPYHYGSAYCERLAWVKDELTTMTLNDIYITLAALSAKANQCLEEARVF